MLRAMIVDDEELAIERLEMILSEVGGVEIGYSTLDPREACEYARTNPVQIAFLDISMPEIDGMSLSDHLRKLDSSIDVVFVTGYDSYAVQAFEVNASDYLLKPVSLERMAKTLERIRERRRSAEPESKVLPELKTILTEQEARVVGLIAEGLPNKEIASRLNITAETVKTHLKNCFRKLEVNNRVQLLRRAHELKIRI
ncbi:response regulator [Cohnella thailandensis]|uniref:Response regulator n=1 Tax=Cohnella thailandensis TaxID=557557 RepID=A0A841STW5_9BACL|nr:response regulator [Cohnella thailandensis]MBB6635763.1 response regulator [Cohnella thailandensis]MBP1976141.1 DNA-binding NarL/FixJ family response regulator [Cohnella thailandensis]